MPEEIPLSSGSRLEVADGVNLDSDSDLETVLIPQISRDRNTSSRSREPSISSAKLKYQSEIRNIIRSYQDLKSSNEQLTEDSDSDTNPDQHQFNGDRRAAGDYFQSHHAYHQEEEEPRYVEDRSHGVRHDEGQHRERPSKSVLFGSNSMNKRIHEEFRQIAKRNQSFKIAMNSPTPARRGSMKESIQRSMEDLHDGFVSLSGKSSRSGSLRSRSNSMASLKSQETLTGETQRRKYSDTSYSSEVSAEAGESQLGRRSKTGFMSRSAAGLDILSRGLGQRRSSRERLVGRRRASRSRSNSRETLGKKIF